MQLFFTVSPDSAGTCSISLKSGTLSEGTIREANLMLLPSRAERKAIAANHPMQCAHYFQSVMKTVVNVLLG